jgi:hypothetical protein
MKSCDRCLAQSRLAASRLGKVKHVNEAVLYALAGVAVTFAGFSGVVVVLPLRDTPNWSSKETLMLRLLIADSLVVLFLALLPVPLSLANWSQDAVWSFCSALLGSWFLIGDFIAVRGEIKDREAKQPDTNPLSAPMRYGIYMVALVMGVVLWLSVMGVLTPAGQALYVVGLMVLLAIAAVEFVFFIGLMLQRGRKY